MVDLQVLTEWRDKLANLSSSSPPHSQELSAEFRNVLGLWGADRDPLNNILSAIELCEAAGLDWVPVSTANDIQYVRHPDHAQASGFHISDGGAALAMCRGIVAELWLAHPQRSDS